jgi:hypothetical protein
MTASTPDLRISRQPHFIRKTHQIEEHSNGVARYVT